MNNNNTENDETAVVAPVIDQYWEILPPRPSRRRRLRLVRPPSIVVAFEDDRLHRFGDTPCRRIDDTSEIMIPDGREGDFLDDVLEEKDNAKHTSTTNTNDNNDDDNNNDDDDSDTESYIEERIRQVQKELNVLKEKEGMLQEKISRKKQEKELLKKQSTDKGKKKKGRAPRKSSSKMIREQQWMEMYLRLKQYKETYGVEPPTHCPEDPKLGTWVNNQRRRKRLANQPQHRLMLLEQIQFEFNGHARSANAPPKKYRKRIKLPNSDKNDQGNGTNNEQSGVMDATTQTSKDNLTSSNEVIV